MKHPEAGQQQGGSQGETPPPKMHDDPPQIPGPQEPNPDTPPINLEQLDVPQPDSKICPWAIASIPICARWEDTDASQDILPGMGFISDFHDVVHWNRCRIIHNLSFPRRSIQFLFYRIKRPICVDLLIMLVNFADYPGQDCPHGESLFCCHFVKPQPILVSFPPILKPSIP